MISPLKIWKKMSNFEQLFDELGWEYKDCGYYFQGACPIHGGDNQTAVALYKESGSWQCFTHLCHERFPKRLVGFIQGILCANAGDDECDEHSVSAREARQYIEKYGCDIEWKPKPRLQHKFVAAKPKSGLRFQDMIVNKVSDYYLKRGFKEETLQKYKIFDCFTKGKRMCNRAVVPIFDVDNEFLLGCSGRSIAGYQPKWLHSKGLDRQNCLYNYYYAFPFVRKDKYVILTEGPAKVWRLEESGIHHSVATFGVNVSDKQLRLLSTMGAMTLVILFDKNEAGMKGTQDLVNRCKSLYNIVIPKHPIEDIDQATVEEVHTHISPSLEELCV